MNRKYKYFTRQELTPTFSEEKRTCDNRNCKNMGEVWWCYSNNERECGIYKLSQGGLI